jgi:hypothetical protein
MTDRNIFSVFVISLMGAMLFGSFNYYETAAFGFPFTVALIVLVMGILLLLYDISALRKKKVAVGEAPKTSNQGAEKSPDVSGESRKKWLEVARIYSFLAGFLVISYFTSYLIAVPVFLFLLTYWYCRERLLPSALVAVVTSGLVYLIFAYILHLR